jgi:hypothetical protein
MTDKRRQWGKVELWVAAEGDEIRKFSVVGRKEVHFQGQTFFEEENHDSRFPIKADSIEQAIKGFDAAAEVAHADLKKKLKPGLYIPPEKLIVGGNGKRRDT